MISKAIYGKPWPVRAAAVLAVLILIVLENDWNEGPTGCDVTSHLSHVAAPATTAPATPINPEIIWD